MTYKVISFFKDRQDCRHSYNVGDVFPRQGISVSSERIKELSTSDNRLGKPLIEKIEDDFSWHMNPPKAEENKYTKTEINRMSTAELKTFAKEQGIDNAEGMTGAELKKVLIEKLGL